MSKEVFAIKAEEDTPAVSMEKGATGSFVSIKGLSMPENPLEFYAPLSEKIFEFFGDNFSNFTLEICLQYMNSMSNKQILKLIKNIFGKDSSMKLVWQYQPNDDLLRMKGEEIKSVFPAMNVTVEESKG